MYNLPAFLPSQHYSDTGLGSIFSQLRWHFSFESIHIHRHVPLMLAWFTVVDFRAMTCYVLSWLYISDMATLIRVKVAIGVLATCLGMFSSPINLPQRVTLPHPLACYRYTFPTPHKPLTATPNNVVHCTAEKMVSGLLYKPHIATHTDVLLLRSLAN